MSEVVLSRLVPSSDGVLECHPFFGRRLWLPSVLLSVYLSQSSLTQEHLIVLNVPSPSHDTTGYSLYYPVPENGSECTLELRIINPAALLVTLCTRVKEASECTCTLFCQTELAHMSDMPDEND